MKYLFIDNYSGEDSHLFDSLDSLFKHLNERYEPSSIAYALEEAEVYEVTRQIHIEPVITYKTSKDEN